MEQREHRDTRRDTERLAMNTTKTTLIQNSLKLMGDNPNHTFYAVTIRPEWSFITGFPYHALEQHLYKLLNAGYRVAICEQVEDPKKSKGIVKREVVEVLSPGTAISEKYLQNNENNFFIMDLAFIKSFKVSKSGTTLRESLIFASF